MKHPIAARTRETANFAGKGGNSDCNSKKTLTSVKTLQSFNRKYRPTLPSHTLTQFLENVMQNTIFLAFVPVFQ